MHFGSHTFVPVSWMCKKQTSVSHSSTESESISLDAGLRLDGLPALDLWDLIVSVLGNTTQTTERPGRPVIIDKSQRSQGKTNVLNNIDCVPSNFQSLHQEALLYVFEDNEAVIKMITKGRSPTMRHVSRTHTVALDWLFDRINLDPKIQIKYIDTKNQLADILTKGNFTRDEWNHWLCLFNISHFSSTVCSETMAKRSQHDSGEERVTAKSRPMMNLIARSSERAPSALSSTASESPRKSRYESQSPLSMQAEKYDRTVKPVVCRDTSHERHRPVENAHSSSYSEWNIDKTWSSTEWQSDEFMDDRTGRPVVCPQGGAHSSQTRFSREHKNVISEEEENHDRTERPVVCPLGGAHQFVIEDDETESELSSASRSFLHRVNDQVRKRQKQSTIDATRDNERQPFCDVGDVHVFHTASICIHGEELLRQYAFHQKYRRSHNETDVRHI